MGHEGQTDRSAGTSGWGRAVLGAGLAASLAWAAPGMAAEADGRAREAPSRRHAGHVISVDPAARRLVVEEMSPGRRIQRIVVDVKSDTPLVEIVREPEEVVVNRTPEAIDLLESHRYVERPLDLASLEPGDFVVVELKGPVASGRGAPAEQVTLTARVGKAPASGSPPTR